MKAWGEVDARSVLRSEVEKGGEGKVLKDGVYVSPLVTLPAKTLGEVCQRMLLLRI